MPTGTSPRDRARNDEGIAEAARWLGKALGPRPLPALIAVIGLREGHLLDVLEQIGPTTRVLALEPDPAAARRFHARRDWSGWRSSNQLTYLTGPGYVGADEAWRMFPSEPDDHLLLVDPISARDAGEARLDAARTFKKILFGARANATARRKFAPRYLLNSLANLPAIVRGSDVSELAGAYRGTPAVIVGAGPSLDHVLQELTEGADRALLIATDTALRPLLAAGIRPPVVVGVDPGQKNARHFDGLDDPSDTWLVAESALDPTAVAAFDDRVFWFRLSDHEPWPWYQTLGVETGHLKIWGSVLTAAFQVAVLAGCDPIVFVGTDLAFTGGRPYARGTTYELDWAFSTAIGDTLERAWQTQMAMCNPAAGLDARGSAVSTTEPLQAFRDWLVTHASRSGRRVINATGAGILIGDKIEQRALGEVLDQRCHVASPRAFMNPRSTRVTSSMLAASCRKVASALDRAGCALPPVPAWTLFSGGVLDSNAIGSVLRATADDLETHHTSRARTVPPQVATALRETFQHMPESLARLRAWLSGVDNGHEDPADAVDSLARALSIVGLAAGAILDSAERADYPLRHDGIGLVPVSGSHAWPTNIMWVLQAAEALIGDACGSVAIDRRAEATESFFTRPTVSPEHDEKPNPGTDAGDDAGNRRLVAQLFDEWTRCALQQSDRSGLATRVDRAMGDRVRVLAGAMVDALVAGAAPDASTADPALVLGACHEGSRSQIELPIGSPARLARAATGILRVDDPAITQPPRASEDPSGSEPQKSSFAVSLRFRGVEHRLFASEGERHCHGSVLTPRVLTDEGVPRAMPGHSFDGGVVCAPLHGVESFVVRENGRIEPHVRWPRPICAILPLGESGHVAWNNGTHNWPEIGSGYVMYRSSARDSIVVDDLPFGPTAGVWWNDRLYWTTYPTGFASWAPGESGAMIDADLTLSGILAEESTLRLGVGERRPDGSLIRRRATREWRWSSMSGLSAIDSGVDGSSTCRCTDRGWEAVVFPESDLIRLRHPGGRTASLSCYYPYLAAWTGESLLVGTIQGELLLFEEVRTAVDRLVNG